MQYNDNTIFLTSKLLGNLLIFNSNASLNKKANVQMRINPKHRQENASLKQPKQNKREYADWSFSTIP